MIWNHGMGWHWLGSLAMILLWVLVILLALVPINYLRAELHAQETGAPDNDAEAAANAPPGDT